MILHHYHFIRTLSQSKKMPENCFIEKHTVQMAKSPIDFFLTSKVMKKIQTLIKNFINLAVHRYERLCEIYWNLNIKDKK